jgi:hypothetical protein
VLSEETKEMNTNRIERSQVDKELSNKAGMTKRRLSNTDVLYLMIMVMRERRSNAMDLNDLSSLQYSTSAFENSSRGP